MTQLHDPDRGEPQRTLQLHPEARERLRQFQGDGLIWLVNAAVLHPRGLALAIHLDDDGEPLGLSVVGDGSEPWCFGPPEELGDVVERFTRAEAAREADWSPKLRGEAGS